MNYTKEKLECTGCGACKQICPKNAIDMVENQEGFLYPQKNSKCIECGLCEKVCPKVNKFNNEKFEQEVYAAVNKNNEIVQNSSSGGAFSAICKNFCNENYIIFGAQYDKDFNVVHGYIDNIDDIEIFRKSKYVQSNIGDSYKKAKKFLEEGKKVVFSGTPCQIAGLKSFLKNNQYENLLCVDIICHGVPSPKVWRKYLEYIETKNNSKIANINFREKTNNQNKWNSKNIKIVLENGKEIIENQNENLYLKGFTKELFFRHSCNVCKFANPERTSDVTLGDCWGIENVDSNLNVHKGVSIIIANTSKGKKVLKNASSDLTLKKLDIQFAIRENAQFREPTKLHKKRNKFFRNIDRLSFEQNIKKCIGREYLLKIKRLIPTKLKRHIKKYLRPNNY